MYWIVLHYVVLWTRTGSLECECWQTSFSVWEANLLVVLRLAEHILALPVTGLIITTSTAIYCEHPACNTQYANLLYCDSSTGYIKWTVPTHSSFNGFLHSSCEGCSHPKAAIIQDVHGHLEPLPLLCRQAKRVNWVDQSQSQTSLVAWEWGWGMTFDIKVASSGKCFVGPANSDVV